MHQLAPLDRRERILNLLGERNGPVTGNDLSHLLGVSRQIIVQDIAILRAQGEEIMATPRGYLSFDGKESYLLKSILACSHRESQVKDELMIMVSFGARVIDVIVEHPLYGELRGSLMLQSKEDVESFLSQQKEKGARLLSSLTGGVHLHTIEVFNREVLTRLREELAEKGYLVE